MKFEIILLALLALMARADYIYTYSKPIQMVPTTTYATTTSYYMPGQTTISSFTKTAPLLQNTQTNVQTSVAPTLVQPQGYMQPVNTLTTSVTRYSLTPATNTFMASPASSYMLAPTFVPTSATAPAPIQPSNFAPVPAPDPILAPNMISTPTLMPAPAPVVDPLSTTTYSSTLSPTGTLQMSSTLLPQPLTQPIPTTTAYSSSLTSQGPSYSTLNYMSGTNNAISGINNSGSGNNNLISGANNCLNGDSNFLMGGNNFVTGSSNTILGDQNCVTGSSNTVLPLPSTLPTSTSLIMGPNVIASGTLPPSPTSLLV